MFVFIQHFILSQDYPVCAIIEETIEYHIFLPLSYKGQLNAEC